MSKSVPDRWLAYTTLGQVIEGTRIVAFKVPLKVTISNNIQPKERFTPKMLLEALPRLKCIVDLTNTDRYYQSKEMLDAGVKYYKIEFPGRQLPSASCVRRFFKVMDEFLASGEPDDLIGVHCTHGVNRTGYLICRYLIQQLEWEPKDAMKAFETARGHAMEHGFYLKDLEKTPKGRKIDTSIDSLEQEKNYDSYSPREKIQPVSSRTRQSKIRVPYPYDAPPGFHSRRRGFANGRPYPRPRPPADHFGFAPGFGHGPPMPPPAPGVPFGPRPMRYGPPVESGFHNPAFPPRMPGPPRMMRPPMPGGPGSRLPPPGPRMPPGPAGPRMPPGPGPRMPPGLGPRLASPGPGMRPPLPVPRLPMGPGFRMPPSPGLGPPARPSMLLMGKGVPTSHKQTPHRPLLSKNGTTMRNLRVTSQKSSIPIAMEFAQDFTADTFEENLAAADSVSQATLNRRNKARWTNKSNRGNK